MFKLVTLLALSSGLFLEIKKSQGTNEDEIRQWLIGPTAHWNIDKSDNVQMDNLDSIEEKVQQMNRGGTSSTYGRQDMVSNENDYYEDYNDISAIAEDWSSIDPDNFNLLKELPAQLDDKFWNEQSYSGGWWKGPNVCHTRREFVDADITIRTYNQKRIVRKAYTRRHGIPYRQDKEEQDLLDLLGKIISNTSCVERWDKYICETRTAHRGMLKISLDTYSCCLNYVLSRNMSQCTRVPRVRILDTLMDLEEKKFLEILQLENVDEMLNENITVFLPTDEALDRFRDLQYRLDLEKIKEQDDEYDEEESVGLDLDYNDDYFDNPDYDERRGYIKKKIIPKFTLRNYGGKVYTGRDLVLNHIVKMPLNLRYAVNNDIFMSLFNDSPLRVNIYENGDNSNLVTINCVPVQQANIRSLGGSVHIIDGVITPIKFTMFDLIFETNKVHTFGKLIRNNNQIHRLLDIEKAYTFLMPTDVAFEKLPRLVQRHIAEATDCGLAILKNHIITDILCGGAVAPKVNARTLEGNVITFERIYNTIVVNGKANITTSDIMATNGIIHLIDEFIIPEKGMLLTQILEDYGLTKFHKTINIFSGLADTWNSLNDRTFFIPDNQALSGGLLLSLEKKGDMETYLSLFGYYMTPKMLKVENTGNNQLLRTLLNEKSRINLYSREFNGTLHEHVTWNCAQIIQSNIHCCGYMIHVVNKFLMPPTFTIYNVLSSSPQFTVLRRVLRHTELKSIINNRWTALTFLAPTDTFFRALNEFDYKIFMRNRIKANEIFLHHLFSDVLCCSGLAQLADSDAYAYAESYAGKQKEIHIEKKGIKIGNVMITKCDVMASNGVIHEVNSIMTNEEFVYSELTYFEYGLIN